MHGPINIRFISRVNSGLTAPSAFTSWTSPFPFTLSTMNLFTHPYQHQTLGGSILPHLHINEASRSEWYISRNWKSRTHTTTFPSNLGRNNRGLRGVRNYKALILLVFHLENIVWRETLHVMCIGYLNEWINDWGGGQLQEAVHSTLLLGCFCLLYML